VRQVIVHYHIFKNAGTSIERLLQAAFGARWASLEGPTPTSLLRPSDLAAFLRDSPATLAVSSHLLRPPAPHDLQVLPVVLIRHPIDRALSVYSQLRRSPAQGQPSGLVAQRSDFREFVRWCLDNKNSGGMVIANYQVIHLSPASFRAGHIFDAVAEPRDLRDAICFLSKGACYGVVDRFDAAADRLRSAASAIGLHIPAMKPRENATSDRPASLGARIEVARGLLEDELSVRLERENELDRRLYEWAGGSRGSG
jgi:hypothetical protein